MIIKQKSSFVSHFPSFCIASARKLKLLVCGATCCVGLCGKVAHAQEVEEVVVEAERSENALVSELTSAAVLDGEKLADAGIENVEDVAAYVPNLVLAETSTGTNIVIRGIGAGVNQGFDQSVGLYVDGVPLPRSQMARAPFLDLAGVQVLRGPQYVNDGNYSIAGSVHMITRAAADEFELDLDFTAIPSQNDRKMLLTLGAPITDRLGARFAIQKQVSDGYVENVFRNEDGPQSDNLLIRSVFNFKASEDLNIKLKYELGSFDTVGRQIEIIESQVTPDFRTFYSDGGDPPNFSATPLGETTARTGIALGQAVQPLTAYGTEQDFLFTDTFYTATYSGPADSGDANAFRDPAFAGRSYLQVLHDIYTGTFPDAPDGASTQTRIEGIELYDPSDPLGTAGTPPIGLLDSTVDFKRAADADEFSNNDSENITLNVDYLLGEHEFSFIASYIDYEIEERIDTDFTPVPILFTDQAEAYEQSFFRFDWQSPSEAFVQFKGGVSYLDSELEFSETIKNNLDGPKNQQEAAEYLYRLQSLRNPTSLGEIAEYNKPYFLFNQSNPFLPYFGRTNRGAVQGLEFFDVDRIFKQDAKITAAFLEAKFNWSERLRTTIGLRYTHSEKNAVRDLAFLLSNGEAFGLEGIAAAETLVVNGLPNGFINPAITSVDDLRPALDSLVQNLGLVFNFQPHTDRIPRFNGFYTQSNFEPNQVIPSSVAGCNGADDQWSFALGGPCDANGGTRTEEQLLPSISVEFDVTPDLSTYMSVQLANKLGGYDARSISTPRGVAPWNVDPGTFEYEDEDAITYELGANWYLPNGWGELRAAAFYTDFTNLQVSSADRSVGQNVRNAGEATTLGIEVEGLLQLTDEFNINYSLAWIQFEFGDYPVAACALGERADNFLITSIDAEPFYGGPGALAPVFYEEANNIIETGAAGTGVSGFLEGYRKAPDSNVIFTIYEDPTTGERIARDDVSLIPAGATVLGTFGGFNTYSNSALGPKVCQFKGRTNQYVADYQGTFTFNYRKEISSLGVMLKPTLDVLYNSGYETTVRLDSDVAQSEYFQYNGRLAISSLEDSWEVAIVGQNLTNEKIIGFASEVPIATRLQGSKTHFGFIRPPRSYGLNFRYKFY